VVRFEHPHIGCYGFALSSASVFRCPSRFIRSNDGDALTIIQLLFHVARLADHVEGRDSAAFARSLYAALRAADLHGADVLLATLPGLLRASLLRGFATVAPPLPTPPMPMFMVWHQRHQADPMHRWLRDELVAVVAPALAAAEIAPPR
jgi:DNA-binding transcriptional LysR family regulator